MITYRTVQTKTEEPASVTCDVCCKTFDYDKDWEETQEFLHIRFAGGYGSVFGDGTEVKSDICQHCLKNKLGEFLTQENSHDNV